MNSESYTLRNVASATETTAGAAIVFADGGHALLSAAHPEYRWSLDRLKMSRDHASPVGIRFQENRIADVAGADRNVVVGLRENEYDPTVLDVWLGGESGPYRLHKDSSLFPQLYQALCKAKESQQWIWYVRAGSDVLDVKLVSPEEDACLCRFLERR